MRIYFANEIKTMHEGTETATQTVDTAQAKAIETLAGATAKKDREVVSGEQKEGKNKKK